MAGSARSSCSCALLASKACCNEACEACPLIETAGAPAGHETALGVAVPTKLYVVLGELTALSPDKTAEMGLAIVTVLLPAKSKATGSTLFRPTINEPESPAALNELLLIATWPVYDRMNFLPEPQPA